MIARLRNLFRRQAAPPTFPKVASYVRLLPIPDDAAEDVKTFASTYNALLLGNYRPCRACGCEETELAPARPGIHGWHVLLPHEPGCPNHMSGEVAPW